MMKSSKRLFEIDFSPLGSIPLDPKDRGPYYLEFQKLIQRGKDRIREWHQSGAGGREVVQANTALTDQILKHLLSDLAGLETYRQVPLLEQFVLVAVGGYGRGELNPQSDIDLLFLHSKAMTRTLDAYFQDVISALWGLNLEIGHSVRTLTDCKTLAAEDSTVRTSMIETRYLIGDHSLHEKLLSSVRNKVLKKRADEFLNDTIKEKFARHESGHRVSSDPEPDIKEGPGGLRDYHAALWAVAVRFGRFSFREIGRDDVITSQEIESLEESVDFLLRVRNELHYQAERKTDVLQLNIQESLAHSLGYQSAEGESPVERFMRDVFLHQTQIFNISESVFQRCLEARATLTRAFKNLGSKDLGNGFFALKSRLTVKENAEKLFEDNRQLLLSIFQLCREHDLKPDAQLRRLIRLNKHLIDEEFIEQDSARRFLLDVLVQPHAEPILRIMHEVGVLGQILPEFGITHCRVRYDFYHRYTADEQALRMIRFLEELNRPPTEGLEKLSALYAEINDPVVLKLACLLHSLAEDGPQEEGEGQMDMAILNRLIKRLQLNEMQAGQLKFLIDNLVTLSEVAFHQDIHQPSIISNLANDLQTAERLDLLVLYTYAELKGVAPDTWTSWKRLLLMELYQRTHNFLEHPENLEESPSYTRNIVHVALAGEVPKEDIDDHIDLMLEDYLITAGVEDVITHIRLVNQMKGQPLLLSHQYNANGGFYDLIVATMHNPDTFMQIVGTLTSKAMNIFGAQIYTREDDIALIHLQVEGAATYDIHGDSDEIWLSVERSVKDLMGRRTTLPKLLASRTRLTSQTESKAAIVPKVEIDNLLENKFSFMRIEARDHPGMLYKIARAFADFNIQIHRAKISCRGGRGIDVFSVSQHGEKIFHETLQRKLKDQIITNLLVEKLEDLR